MDIRFKDENGIKVCFKVLDYTIREGEDEIIFNGLHYDCHFNIYGEITVCGSMLLEEVKIFELKFTACKQGFKDLLEQLKMNPCL